MQFIRGTTPTIIITVQTEIDLHQVAEVWIYISQQNKVKVDKELTDVTFDYEQRIMSVKLSQDDTLALKEGDAAYQATAPSFSGSFSGTGAELKFTGSASSGTISGTAAAQTFTGTGARLVTDSQVLTGASFTGASMTSTGSVTATGSVATATTENKTVTVS